MFPHAFSNQHKQTHMLHAVHQMLNALSIRTATYYSSIYSGGSQFVLLCFKICCAFQSRLCILPKVAVCCYQSSNHDYHSDTAHSKCHCLHLSNTYALHHKIAHAATWRPPWFNQCQVDIWPAAYRVAAAAGTGSSYSTVLVLSIQQQYQQLSLSHPLIPKQPTA